MAQMREKRENVEDVGSPFRLFTYFCGVAKRHRSREMLTALSRHDCASPGGPSRPLHDENSSDIL